MEKLLPALVAWASKSTHGFEMTSGHGGKDKALICMSCVYVCVCTCICVYVHVCMYVCIYVCMYVCM